MPRYLKGQSIETVQADDHCLGKVIQKSQMWHVCDYLLDKQVV
jgi:hypothetical protein